ncbi:CPBP family intramembrane glutamic endopeptidase [Brotaphodocola sp.]|uniref:CPBP family intramembrane glutamic endopeptidase n=1 Tax=Brotaphodocola sp. TaxID=3073577 RepID=UPI003D7CFF36
MNINAKKQLSHIAWAYVIFLIVNHVASFFLTIALRLFSFATAGIFDLSFLFRSDVAMLLSQFTMYGIAFPVFAWVMNRIPSWKKTDKKTIPASDFAVLLIFCFGMTYIGNLIGQYLMAIASTLSGTVQENPLDDLITGMHVGVVFLTTVLIAPVMEELMFRKYLIDRLVPFGQKTAVVLSGLSFGLFHGNCFQFFYATMLGMVFAYLYSTTGRIRYNIALHMIINFVGGVIPILLADSTAVNGFLSLLISILFGGVALSCMIIAAVIFFLYIGKLKWFPRWIFLKEPVGITLLKAPGVWFFLAATGISFVISWISGS